MDPTTPQTTPTRLDLKRDEKLEIDWADGRACVYPLAYLRQLCPCAQCKIVREGQKSAGEPKETRRTSLTILPGNYAAPLSAVGAELVGNYAIRIEWSDSHGSGIYSFRYLRDICRQ